MNSTEAFDFLRQAIREMRKSDPWMGVQTVEVFLAIALKPGLTMKEIAEVTGLAQSSCSRNVALLSKYHRLKKAGADLVETYEDPAERRRKIVFLNERGIEKARQIISHVNPNATYNPVRAHEKLKGYI